jgi:hypothetical protein
MAQGKKTCKECGNEFSLKLDVCPECQAVYESEFKLADELQCACLMLILFIVGVSVALLTHITISGK